MTAAFEQMGVTQVFPRPPMKTLFKYRYFVSGSGIGSDSGIAQGFKDPALDSWTDISNNRVASLLKMSSQKNYLL